MRYESSVTSLSWIPSEAVTGSMKAAFESGLAHYDNPPPDELTPAGEDSLAALQAADRFRFANHFPFLQSPSAVGTLRRQGYFDYLIDGSGDGTTTSASVLSPWFASRFLGTCFRVPPRERRRLPFCSAQRFF